MSLLQQFVNAIDIVERVIDEESQLRHDTQLAAGGIRTLDATLAMISAGAERIGSSASVQIVEEYAACLQRGVQ